MNPPPDAPRPIIAPTRIPGVVTRPLSWVYALGIGLQNARYDRGIGVTRLDRPVVSIGNLSTGGTGKTPVVHWVARRLIERGAHPVIAMRGYGALPGEPSDEQREHLETLGGIEVVARPDRAAGLRALFAGDKGDRFDCVILDDGFQHRKIARDLDIVLIDASSPPDRDALLPRGSLREPVSSLSRADALIITHREMVDGASLDELTRWIGSRVPSCPVAVASHVWTHVDFHARRGGDWTHEQRRVADLVGRPMLGVCAIGNPGAFFAQIERSGWMLADRIPLPDHAPLGAATGAMILERAASAGASIACMTHKDWVKARHTLDPVEGFAVAVPRLGIEFSSGEAPLLGLIAGSLVANGRSAPGSG